MATPKKTINQTESAAAELKRKHDMVLSVTHMDEGAWHLKFTGAGYQFAERISCLFGQYKVDIEVLMLLQEAEPDCEENWYWQWFKYKYMNHDCEYINQEVYTMPTSYDQYKTYLLFSSHMEKEIVNLLERKFC